MRTVPTFSATAALVLGISLSLPAFGQDRPDLLGEWTGTVRFMAFDPTGAYGDQGTEPQYREPQTTLTLIEENDGRYLGTMRFGDAEEAFPKILIVASDGSRLFAADLNGTSSGWMIDENHFELCHTQSNLEQDHMVVSCIVFERSNN